MLFNSCIIEQELLQMKSIAHTIAWALGNNKQIIGELENQKVRKSENIVNTLYLYTLALSGTNHQLPTSIVHTIAWPWK